MTVVLIVFLFPKGGKFKYDYFKGKPWLYENYYAPFNFAIQKTQEDINIEKLKIEQDVTLYFEYDKAIVESVYSNFDIALEKNPLYEEVGSIASDYGKEIISAVYKSGFIGPLSEDKLSPNSLAVTIRKGTLAIDIAQKDLIKSKDLLQYINASMLEISSQVTRNLLLTTLSEVIKPNIRFDEEFTNKVKNDQINNISYTTGFVAEKELVILKGDIVEGKKLKALNSIQRELESQVWSESNYNWVVFGMILI